MAEGIHLFPYRTQKLSLLTPMVLGGRPPGRLGSCQTNLTSILLVFFCVKYFNCLNFTVFSKIRFLLFMNIEILNIGYEFY